MKKVNQYTKDVLINIYEYRALTFEQLVKLTGRTYDGIYYKLNDLAKKGFIETEGISHIKQSAHNYQGKYAVITDKGISLLNKMSYSTNREAKRNRPTKNQLQQIILANDIRMNINKENWLYRDSRDTKKLFNRNLNEQITASVENTQTEDIYCLYIMPPLKPSEKEPSEKYTSLIIGEIEKQTETMKTKVLSNNNPYKNITDYIILCKGEEWFSHWFRLLPEIASGIFLARIASIRVLPFEIGKVMIEMLGNEAVKKYVLEKITELTVPDTNFKTSFELDVTEKSFGFDYKLELEGRKEYYVSELLTMDIKKIYKLVEYTAYNYEKLGNREVIVYAPSYSKELIKDVLNYPYMKIQYLSPDRIVEWIKE